MPLPVAGLLLGLWSAWLVAAELGRPIAQRVWHTPFVSLVLPLMALSSGSACAVWVLGPLLFWLSGDNAVVRWTRQAALVRPECGWAVLIAATLVVGAVSAGQSSSGAPTWLVFLVWLHTGLTVIWAAGSEPVWAARGLPARLLAMRGAGPTEVCFLGLAALVTFLAWA